MDFKSCRAVVIIVSFMLLLNFPASCFSSNFQQTYTFHTMIGNNENSHNLFISIPPSLYEYYQKMSHGLGIDSYSKFVTPNVFVSIAENIRNVTNNTLYEDEAFANAVLELVHQIPYNKTIVKFPVETIVDNFGDCDTLSVLTASIMKAGGLDVVLLVYENSSISHMNIGVHLSREPSYFTGKKEPIYYEYNGKKYYTAETTGDYWRVGEQPQNYVNSEAKIIPIENNEAPAYPKIASFFEPLTPSSISLNLLPDFLSTENGGINITIFGSISPRFPNQTVIISVNHKTEQQLSFQKTTVTDNIGDYSLNLTLKKEGTFTIQASWSGLQNYAGSDSNLVTVNIGLSRLLEQYEVEETEMDPNGYVNSSVQIPKLTSTGYMILNNQHIPELMNENFTVTNSSLCSKFIILGSNESFIIEHEIVIPEHEQIITRGRQISTIIVPEQRIIEKNYRHLLDNHIELSLIKKSEEDISLRMSLVNNSAVSRIANESDVIMIDISNFIHENSWYNFKVNAVDDQITLGIFDENDTQLFTIKPDFNQTNGISQYKILMKYVADSVIVLKNLQGQTIDSSDNLVEENLSPFNIPPFEVSVEKTSPEEPSNPPENELPANSTNPEEPTREKESEEPSFRFDLITELLVIVGGIVAIIIVGFVVCTRGKRITNPKPIFSI